jgi:hypothetical protein
MTGLWGNICRQIEVSKELDADIPLLKINLISHWVEQSCRYAAFQQESEERHELTHQTKLKDSWNASNHNINYLPQVIAFQRRIVGYKSREFNLSAITQGQEN